MRDYPTTDFYIVGANGLPVKKPEASQEKQSTRDRPAYSQTLN